MKYLITLLIASTLFTSCGSDSNKKPVDTTGNTFSYEGAIPTTIEVIEQRFKIYQRKGLLMETYLTSLTESQPKAEETHTIVYLNTTPDSVYKLHVYVNLLTNEKSTNVTKEGYSVITSNRKDLKYYKKNNVYHLTHNPAKDSLNDFETSHVVYNFTDVNYFTAKYRSSFTTPDGKFLGTATAEMNGSFITDLTKYEEQLKNIQFCDYTSTYSSSQCKDNQDMTWLLE